MTIFDLFAQKYDRWFDENERIYSPNESPIFAEPSPQIELRQIGKTWHLGKVLFEQWWLAPPGLRRETLRLALTLGGKALGIPIII